MFLNKNKKKISLWLLILVILFYCESFLFCDSLPNPDFNLNDWGTEEIIDYTKYGNFENIGVAGFKYTVKDKAGLARAAGSGIYPNNQSIYKEPAFQKFQQQKKLAGNHWDFSGRNRELNFYKWAIAAEAPGVKAYNVALNLERSGLIMQAIKAYHAVIIHFSQSVGYTVWKTPWYPAMAAGDKIEYLLRKYPDLKLQWQDGEMIVVNSFDNNVQNDIVVCNPGKFIKGKSPSIQKNLNTQVKKIVGKGKVQLHQYENGHWQLRVDGKLFMIQAIAYNPTPVGQSPEFNTLANWMQADMNKNGIMDAPYESWVDSNRNNKKDSNEPIVGDFQLLKDMGVNVIRIYHIRDHPKAKKILRELYEKYGIMTIIGDFVGMYARDSGATWKEGTDYRNLKQRQIIFDGVKKVVSEYKDEPYVLFWMLGNENVFGSACNANQFPREYFEFINEISQWIHQTDTNHPVAISNGDVLYLDLFAKYAPDIDIFGANVYRGEHGFGKSFWRAVKMNCDKPVVVTEYGCPAYFKAESEAYSEEWQAKYLEGNWNDIVYNTYGSGYGNALGGVVFEWLDEWWKTLGMRDPKKHKIDEPWGGPFPDGNMYEEWLGLVSQGDGQNSPLMRQLRPAYFLYKDKLWKNSLP